MEEKPFSVYKKLRCAFNLEALTEINFNDNKINNYYQALFVDWVKAEKILTEEFMEDNRSLWEIFVCEVGFVKERVLQVVDPAIKKIISRLMDIDVIPLFSCSGHTNDIETNPYLEIIFADKQFGRQFVATLTNLGFQELFKLQGHSYPIIPNFGFLSNKTFNQCIEEYLPILIMPKELPMNSVKNLRSFWTVFSRIINRFDRSSVETIDPFDFNIRNKGVLSKEFYDVYNYLRITQ